MSLKAYHQWQSIALKMDSHCQKVFLSFALMLALQKIIKICYYSILKAIFDLKIFKILSWLLGYVAKAIWLER